jgi:hypothetical protein
MVPLLLSTVISCSGAISVLNRLTSVVGLTPQQKKEITSEIRQLIPTCPITIKKDEPSKK